MELASLFHGAADCVTWSWRDQGCDSGEKAVDEVAGNRARTGREMPGRIRRRGQGLVAFEARVGSQDGISVVGGRLESRDENEAPTLRL